MYQILTIVLSSLIPATKKMIGSQSIVSQISDLKADLYLEPSINGVGGFSDFEAAQIKFGMERNGIIFMPEFKGMTDPSQLMSEFMILIGEAGRSESTEDRNRIFELGKNLVRLNYIDFSHYLELSKLMYNFTEDKYKYFQSLIESLGYFIVTPQTRF